MTYDDPGWRPAFKLLPQTLNPFVRRTWDRRRNVDGITRLRALYLQRFITLVSFFVVLSFVTREDIGRRTAAWVPWVVIAVGICSLSGLIWLRSDRWLRFKGLDALDPKAAASAYKGVFLIGIGLVYSVVLMGYVGVFLSGRIVIYLLGLAFGVPGFLFIAPSQGDIERRQRQLDERGATFSLGQALMDHRDWRRR